MPEQISAMSCCKPECLSWSASWIPFWFYSSFGDEDSKDAHPAIIRVFDTGYAKALEFPDLEVCPLLPIRSPHFGGIVSFSQSEKLMSVSHGHKRI